MPRRRARPSLAVLVVATVALVATGCGPSDDAAAPTTSASPRSSDVGPATSTTAQPSTSTAPTDATTGGSTPSPLVMPVTTTTSPGGNPMVVVEVSVGGGAPVPVQLDTGSSGLIVDETAVGPSVTPDPGGATFTENYVNSSVTGTAATAVVTLGNVSTAAPIEIGLISAADAASNFGGTRGIMGIAATLGSSSSRFAPQLQLPAPYDSGSTLAIAAEGPGTWTLGPAPQVAGATTVALQAATSPATYPNGAPAFAKDVQLCWVIGQSVDSCGPTDLDIGAGRSLVDVTAYPGGQAHEKVPAGQAVTVSTPGGQTLWAFTTSGSSGPGEVVLESLGDQTTFNTGISFLFGRTVAFDYARAELRISSGALGTGTGTG